MASRNPATISPERSSVALNGATPVTVAAAAASSVIGSDFIRKVICLRFSNIDTAVVTITLDRIVKGSAAVQCDKITGLAVDGVWTPVKVDDGPIILKTGDSLVAFMSGAPTTRNPVAFAEFEDVRFQN